MGASVKLFVGEVILTGVLVRSFTKKDFRGMLAADFAEPHEVELPDGTVEKATVHFPSWWPDSAILTYRSLPKFKKREFVFDMHQRMRNGEFS